jgi:hypothetical protein
MSENFVYYGKHKRKKEPVRQEVVRRSVKKSVRFDEENFKNIQVKVNYYNSLDDKMKTDFSKTLNDILRDYFLDEKIEQQKIELEGLNDANYI